MRSIFGLKDFIVTAFLALHYDPADDQKRPALLSDGVDKNVD
ncbi:hypothetical protein [Undibacterium sp. GrIS 1.2]